MLKKISVSIIILMLITAASAFAGNKPLLLKSSTPKDGETNVAIDTNILIEFTKNVVNMKVSKNNVGCFKMMDSSGRSIDIEVYLPDDQLEPENKRKITLKPIKPLCPDTKYTIIISSELKAKNGNSLGKELILSFVTAK